MPAASGSPRRTVSAVFRVPLRMVPLVERARLLPLVAALGSGCGVVVLAHHRIGTATGTPGDPALFSATQEELDEQLRLIGSFAQLIAPDDLEDAMFTRGRHVLLTFDDGYADARRAALPVLEARGLRAAFFIATGFIDRPRLPWWDELTWIATLSAHPERAPGWIAHYKQLGADAAEVFVDELARRVGVDRADHAEAAGEWCTWDDVRALQAAGMELGGHTHDHPVLGQATPAQQREQIGASLDRLEAETARRPRWFAYPVGGRNCFGQDTRSVLRDQSIRFAFSAYGGWNPGPSTDRYDIRRITASADPSRLRAQLCAPQAFVGGRRARPARSR